LAKVAVQCSAETFMVNQTLVLRINICGKNRHLRQAANHNPPSKYSFSFLAPLHKFTKKSNGKGNIKAAMFNYIDQWKQGGLAQKTFVRNIKSATVFFIIGISNTRKKMVRT